LGVKYSLVSKYTSFIAVEDRSDERSNWFFAPPPVQPVTRTVTNLSAAAPLAPSGYAFNAYSAPVALGRGGGGAFGGSGARGPPPGGAPSFAGAPGMALSSSSSLYRNSSMAPAAPPARPLASGGYAESERSRKKGMARKSEVDCFMDCDEAAVDMLAPQMVSAPSSSFNFFGYSAPQPQQQQQILQPQSYGATPAFAGSFGAPPAPAPATSSLWGAPATSASYPSAATPVSSDPRSALMTLLKLQKVSSSSLLSSSNSLLLILVSFQIDGSFEASPALASSLRLALSELTNVSSSGVALPNTPEGIKVWTTALVLAFLNGVHASLKDDWELVAEKSKSWVTKQLRAFGASVSVDDLVSRASSSLTSAGIF